jgi:hypothetical protein
MKAQDYFSGFGGNYAGFKRFASDFCGIFRLGDFRKS